MSEPIIVVEGVHKVFGEHRALDGVSLSVQRGAIVALLGPNGAGKTTMVSVLSTLLAPSSGRAIVGGFDVVEQPEQVRRIISLTGQFAAVDQELTGRENLTIFGRLLGLGRSGATARCDELLERFELADAAGTLVRNYSGGMRRRLDLAVSLLVDPQVLFLDEPTTGLDPRSRRNLWSEVERLRDQGITVLLTTQYLEEADLLADRIVVIDHGRVIAEGTPTELKARVGGTRCHIVPADPNALGATSDLLSDLSPYVDEAEGAVSLPAPDGPATLTECVRRLDGAGVELADIALRSPSLDDVFLVLTGQTASGDAEAGEGQPR